MVCKGTEINTDTFLCFTHQKKIILNIIKQLSEEGKCINNENVSKILILHLILGVRIIIWGELTKDFVAGVARKIEADKEDISYEVLKNVAKYSPAKVEELISIVHETDPLRAIGRDHGSLKRKQKGAFYTPYDVARLIAKEALKLSAKKLCRQIKSGKGNKNYEKLYNDFLSLKIIDPACGIGIILSATIDELADINKSIGDKLAGKSFYKEESAYREYIVKRNISGVDLDSKAILITRLVLGAKNLQVYRDLNDNIKYGNALSPEDLTNPKAFSFLKDYKNVFSSSGGFDVVVMNPPYERLKVDNSDYDNLDEQSVLCNDKKKSMAKLVKSIRSSNQYPLSSSGVLDLYKLFIERALQITNKTGIVSFIVPFTLLGDRSCTALRQTIFGNTKVSNVYCIPEHTKLFYNVSQAFCILAFKKEMKQTKVTIHADVSSVNPIKAGKKVAINKKDLNLISPTTLSLPITDEKGWNILKKIHKNPRLSECQGISNLRGELDLTFGKKYITTDMSEEVLIRGNRVDAYSLKDVSGENGSYAKLKEIIKEDFLNAKLKYVNTERIVCQQISNMGIKKRLRFAHVQKGILANSCNFISIKNGEKEELLYMLGILNSSLLNWRFKLTSTNNHINNYELDELPIVRKDSVDDNISNKVIELVSEQCKKHSEDNQHKIDELVCKIYGITPQMAKQFNA